jgi:hypothetical protein
MPSGHYKRTKLHGNRISNALQGRIGFWEGKSLSESHKKNISKSLIGRKLSKSHKKKLSNAKMGKNHPLWGKHLSDDVKEKIRKSLCGKNHYLYGKHPSIESKNKMSLSQHERFKKPGEREKLKLAAQLRWKSEDERVRAKVRTLKNMTLGIGFKPSKSATLFLNELEKLWNCNIHRECEVGGRLFDGKTDDILIEVDGKYWHTFPKQVEIDKEKELIAKLNGYRLVRFEVNNTRDILTVINSIKDGEQKGGLYECNRQVDFFRCRNDRNKCCNR